MHPPSDSLYITITHHLTSATILQISLTKRNEKSRMENEIEKNGDLTQFPGLLSSNVKISDLETVNEKLIKMAREGPNTLMVIFDFDKTLSKPTKSREPVFSSLEIFQEMKEVPEWYKTEIEKIWSDLDFIFENPNSTREEKEAATISTVEEYTNRIKKLQIGNIPQLIVRETIRTIELRDNTMETFSILNNSSVATTVLSAGLGDAIIAAFQTNGIDVSSLRIIANFLKFSDGKIDGFTDYFIQPFNKNELAMKNKSHSEDIKGRQNIIVVGDSLSDVDMADGAPPTANKLTIGFLNHDVEKKLASYLKTFDIVLIEDPTMTVVNNLLEDIINHH